MASVMLGYGAYEQTRLLRSAPKLMHAEYALAGRAGSVSASGRNDGSSHMRQCMTGWCYC